MENQDLVPVLSRQEKIRQLLEVMNQGLLERNEQLKLMLLAALAGEHVLLLGPPGTAKSELAKCLRNIFVEANYFERLLTRFSVPEELFGPLSIQALEEDKYKRLTSGYLPEASIAFIDEIFKANSAILNSLLTLLNERQFDNGNRRYSVPLISVIAASNELPEGEELSALYDRFMLRSFVQPVSDQSFIALLKLENSDCDPDLAIRLKVEELHEVQKMAEKVSLSPSVLELCNEFRRYLAVEKIYVSDRRWRKIIKLMKVSAFSSGFDEVSNYDAWVLPHCLWDKPDQLEGLQDIYKRAIAIDGDFSPKRVSTLLSAMEQLCEKENSAQTTLTDQKGRPFYKSPAGKKTKKEKSEIQKRDEYDKPLYKDHYGGITHREHGNDPAMEEVSNEYWTVKTTYSQAHISARVNEANTLTNNIREHIERLDDQLQQTAIIFSQHLWIDPALLPDITSSIQSAKGHSEKLLMRANKLIKGFESLPCEKDVFTNIDTVDFDEEGDLIEGEVCD